MPYKIKSAVVESRGLAVEAEIIVNGKVERVVKRGFPKNSNEKVIRAEFEKEAVLCENELKSAVEQKEIDKSEENAKKLINNLLKQ